MTPESFAQIMADDVDTPVAQQFVQPIAQEIRRQCAVFASAVEEDVITSDTEEQLNGLDTQDEYKINGTSKKEHQKDDSDDDAEWMDIRLTVKVRKFCSFS